MERENRNQTASFLMVVGIIFIVVAGTIFVSSAWKYLPTGGKQGVLFLITLGLFAGAWKTERNGILEKTETALYYLAASFLGLFTLSVCGGIMGVESSEWIVSEATGWNAPAIGISSMVMLCPIVFRFVRKRNVFDFTMMALLADWVVFWFEVSNNYGLFGCCVLSAVGLTVYTFADYLRETWQRNDKNVEQVFIALYAFHAVTFIFRNMTLLMLEDEAMLKLALFTMALFMIVITGVICVTRKQTVFRVFNSIAAFWLIITGVNFVNELLSGGTEYPWNGEMVHFITFTLCAICMVVLERTEMIWAVAIWGVLIPFVQLFQFGDYDVLFSHVEHSVSTYIPFTGVLVAAMAGLIVKRLHSGKLDLDEAKPYGMAVAIQVIVMFIMLYASKYPFLEKAILGMITVQFLAVTFLFENRIIKNSFRTIALLTGEVFMCTMNCIPADYRVDWNCFMWAAGVFLLGVIWKDAKGAKESIEILQFICACMISVILLASDVISGGVGNALILGIAGVAMLVLAAVFNNKRYVVLSSIILILLVFYITRSFWFSIAWWVYLFAAGVALIALAIKKEREGR